MRFSLITRGFLPGAFGVCAWLFVASVVVAQNNNNNNGGNNNGNNNNNSAGFAGIDIDAAGVLRVSEVDPMIANAQRLATLRSNPNGARTSPLRKVSLNRLEKFVAKEIEAGHELDVETMSLAGLTRIEYVFFMPDSKDIVIAGPADQWHLDTNNRFVGLSTGRSTLRLDDLIVALRAFAPNNGATISIGCSIDPTEEGLKRMKQYHAQLGETLSGNIDGRQIAMGFKDSLGLQTVSIRGVPRDTHFAQVLVEADYRMKLIGIGLQDPMVRMSTWIQRTQPGANSNALQRWYFEADYSSVTRDENGNAIHLQGQGVKLTGELEGVTKDGKRSRTGKKGDKASTGFTTEFTSKFNAIAEMSPVFFEMRNLFDMSIAAAFIQDRDLYARSGWSLGIFDDEKVLPVKNNPIITQVESAVNAVWKEGQLITPIGGGVHIAARRLVETASTKVEPGIDSKQGELAAPADLGNDQWWWD